LNGVVVIQARTNSSRLPAKVLLPIGGMPAVVLAARRAANTGRQVIVAISNEESDDYLASIILEYGLICFRGDLENTLGRFVEALVGFDDDTIFFRLTADNIIPDGKLLDEIEYDFIDRGLEYLVCNGIHSGLPYGVSAEVSRVKHLRQALASNPDKFDMEHVTPSLIRRLGVNYFEKYASKEMGHYRCTIDSLDDYLCIASLFKDIKDPVQEDSFGLIDRLKGMFLQPLFEKPANKLVLGAAQLGMAYGVTNLMGRPDQGLTNTLIKMAISNGVEFIDTARAYGASEDAIGHVLASGWRDRISLITKLSPLDDLPGNSDIPTCNAFVDESIYRSLNALGVEQVDILLLHRSEHLEICKGQVWNRLLTHQEQGKVKSLGVSVQSPGELLKVLCVPEIEHIQLPLNILDGRWSDLEENILAAKAKRRLHIHVRSVYLQGLLLTNDQALWSRANVTNYHEIQVWLSNAVKLFSRDSVKDLCLAYVNGLKWVDGIVVGMETLAQLHENLALMNKPSLNDEQIKLVKRTCPRINESSLNPAMWMRGSA
jgi:spore coat polysaccharide biosynthesis protein SpsF